MSTKSKSIKRRFSSSESEKFDDCSIDDSCPTPINVIGTYMDTPGSHTMINYPVKLSKLASSTSKVRIKNVQGLKHKTSHNLRSGINDQEQVDKLKQQILDLEFRRPFQPGPIFPALVEAKSEHVISKCDRHSQTDTLCKDAAVNTQETPVEQVSESVIETVVCGRCEELNLCILQLQNDLEEVKSQRDLLLEESKCHESTDSELLQSKEKCNKLLEQTSRLESYTENVRALSHLTTAQLNRCLCDSEVRYRSDVEALERRHKKELEALEIRNKTESDKMKDLLAQCENRYKALAEEKLNSTIRLCVVAPPIHLHVRTLPDAMNFTPPVDCEMISSFMRDQIHPQLCNLFIQGNSADSEFKHEMKAWIEQKISSLEQSIERHVVAAFNPPTKS